MLPKNAFHRHERPCPSDWVRLAVQLSLFGVCLLFAACGGSSSVVGSGNGGNNNGGTGGSGGGGNIAPQITLVTPSQINTNAADIGVGFFVHGSNFSQSSTVDINGSPAASTYFQDSTLLSAFPNPNQITTTATYSISVSGSTGQSNALPLTVYQPPQGPEPFIALPGYSPGVEDAVPPIATGDFNGDGHDDVVIGAGPLFPGLAVMFGQADGTLDAPQYLGSGVNSLAVGDVNGDSFPDIVAGVDLGSQPVASSVTVYSNDGAGNFTAGAPLTFAGSFPGPMALADIRGTGKNDLILSVNNPSSLYLFPNQGNGTFGQPVTIASLGPDRWFAVADFNGDGRPDIAYEGVNASTGNPNTHLLINQGGGVFTDVVPAELANAGGIMVVGDFNDDGLPDLAIQVSNQSSVSLQTFLNMGNNSFANVSSLPLGFPGLYAPFQFAVGDFDHDGFLDIAAENGFGSTGASSVVFLWGDGTGHFTQQEVIGPSGFGLATADINGDGIPDILVPDAELAITVLLGHTGRSYPQPTVLFLSNAVSMAIGDVNGDGFPDLLFAGAPSAIFLNDGHGEFTLAGNPPLIGNGPGEELADLNRSGKANLIGLTVNSSGGESVVIYPATGDPNYSGSPIAIPIPPGITLTSGYMVADLDGDGLPELVFDEGIAWNQGNYQFTFVPLNMNGVPAVADVNGDGKPDLITPDGTFLNLGNRQFRNIHVNGLPVTEGYQVVFGDFNGDGIVDVAYADLVTEQYIGVAYGQGDGTFVVQSSFATSESTLGNVVKLIAGDFNGDGKTDLVAPLFFGPHVLVLTSNGNAQFQTAYFATGLPAYDMLSADLNMDGKMDFVLLPTIPAGVAEIIFGK